MVAGPTRRWKWADQTACKPGSVPPRVAPERGGHSSGPAIAGRFSRPTRTARAGEALPKANPRRVVPIRSCSRRGLPCRPGHPVRGGLLPHPFTLSSGRSPRWFAFCGAIPGVTPGGRYPPPCRRGARTFLGPAEAKPRPPGRLVRCEGGRSRGDGQAEAPLSLPRRGRTPGHDRLSGKAHA